MSIVPFAGDEGRPTGSLSVRGGLGDFVVLDFKCIDSDITIKSYHVRLTKHDRDE